MNNSSTIADWLHRSLGGRFLIEREIGRGGMATVFLARDTTHDRPVAIKVLHRDVASGFLTERFLREIRVLATLQHPNILPLHDSGSIDGVPYFVMPYVAGESIRDRISREGQLPVSLAVRFAAEAASALDYAHRQGIVHRDIKPENILLSDDHVVIADFGIALAAANSADDRLTGTAVAIGTLAYMSPEQATGEANLDGKSDVYSLACVLFEMLAGKTPFTGNTAAAVVASRFAKAPARMSSIRPEVNRSIDNAIASALVLSPEERPSAREFGALLSGDKPSSASRRRLIPRRWIGVGAVLLLAAAGAFIGYKAYRARPLQSAGADPSPTGARRSMPRTTTNVAAHEFYLKGRSASDRPTAAAQAEALANYTKAVEHDSLYAQAWSGIGEIRAAYGIGNLASRAPRPEFEQARFAVSRALSLDSTLAEAHAVLGLVQMMYDFDWDASLASLRRARALDPAYDQTYLYLGFLFSWRAEYDSALAVNREALRMIPSSNRTRQDLGRILTLARRFDQSEAALRAGVARDSTNGRLQMLLGDCLLARGRTGEAVKALERGHRLLPQATRVTAFLIAAYSRAGRTLEASALMDSLSTASDNTFVAAMDFAIAWAGHRNTNETLAWLERAYNDRTLRPFMRDPVFDFLIDEPHYRALFARMKLPPPSAERSGG